MRTKNKQIKKKIHKIKNHYIKINRLILADHL
jgi:hypothetical protein